VHRSPKSRLEDLARHLRRNRWQKKPGKWFIDDRVAIAGMLLKARTVEHRDSAALVSTRSIRALGVYPFESNVGVRCSRFTREFGEVSDQGGKKKTEPVFDAFGVAHCHPGALRVVQRLSREDD
jgi:hypothetical protein